jgi:predicted Zn-dependent protease
MFKRLFSVFSRYRVVETDGVFIAQIRGDFWFDWKGIDRKDLTTWYSPEYQRDYCGCKTLDEAKAVIQRCSRNIHYV